MTWIPLTSETQLQEILEKSIHTPQLIYKHSTRCGVSSAAKSRLENSVPPPGVDFYFLDVLTHRPLSQKIAKDLGIRHESPQILLIRNGQCVYDESHQGIRMDRIATQASPPESKNTTA